MKFGRAGNSKNFDRYHLPEEARGDEDADVEIIRLNVAEGFDRIQWQREEPEKPFLRRPTDGNCDGLGNLQARTKPAVVTHYKPGIPQLAVESRRQH
jgi:hypothetical protein